MNWAKSRITSVRLVAVQAEIRTGGLPNTRQKSFTAQVDFVSIFGIHLQRLRWVIALSKWCFGRNCNPLLLNRRDWGSIQEHDTLSRTVIGQNGMNVTLMRLDLERLLIQIWSQTNATAISIAMSSRHHEVIWRGPHGYAPHQENEAWGDRDIAPRILDFDADELLASHSGRFRGKRGKSEENWVGLTAGIHSADEKQKAGTPYSVQRQD
jgi:hypothetical protein